MRASLLISFLLHALILAWGVISLPWPEPLDSGTVEAIPVEFIQISDTTDIVAGLPTAAPSEAPPQPDQPADEPTDTPPDEPQPDTPPPPPPPPVPEPPPLPETPTLEPPEPETPPEPTPPPPEPEPEPPPPEPEPAPPEPEPEPPPEPDTQEPPPEPVPETPPEDDQTDDIASLLQGEIPIPRIRPRPPAPATQVASGPPSDAPPPADTPPVEDSDPLAASIRSALRDQDAQTTTVEAPPTLGAPGAIGTGFSTNELDLLASRMIECWSPPIGWLDPSEISVRLLVSLNRDGTLAGNPVVEQAPAGRYAQTAPESAIRAVRRCAPYILPPEKYDGQNGWNQVRIHFEPRNM